MNIIEFALYNVWFIPRRMGIMNTQKTSKSSDVGRKVRWLIFDTYNTHKFDTFSTFIYKKNLFICYDKIIHFLISKSILRLYQAS